MPSKRALHGAGCSRYYKLLENLNLNGLSLAGHGRPPLLAGARADLDEDCPILSCGYACLGALCFRFVNKSMPNLF